MLTTIHPVNERTPAQAAALKSLSVAVYPPEIAALWPGRSREWTPAQWSAVVWAEDGAALCHVGIVLRDGTMNGVPVRIGGIGGVCTHPQCRCQGHAADTIRQALAFLQWQAADFALLVCEARLIPYYEGLGWAIHSGPVRVRQFGEVETFTFNVPMTHSLNAAGPLSGDIDLLGPPW
jgi:aminoglycoside 2'-N-acetyltransferase I